VPPFVRFRTRAQLEDHLMGFKRLRVAPRRRYGRTKMNGIIDLRE